MTLYEQFRSIQEHDSPLAPPSRGDEPIRIKTRRPRVELIAITTAEFIALGMIGLSIAGLTGIMQ